MLRRGAGGRPRASSWLGAQFPAPLRGALRAPPGERATWRVSSHPCEWSGVPCCPDSCGARP
ncbi:hypothetical protein ABT127_07155 [Streptomyces sp. NPDC001904]|uniref:hypothetical protein n=1 Tax=Streptomyces sp. NPDC001904 TaxID=3154531 RepID=UPI0033178CF4